MTLLLLYKQITPLNSNCAYKKMEGMKWNESDIQYKLNNNKSIH